MYPPLSSRLGTELHMLHMFIPLTLGWEIMDVTSGPSLELLCCCYTDVIYMYAPKCPQPKLVWITTYTTK